MRCLSLGNNQFEIFVFFNPQPICQKELKRMVFSQEMMSMTKLICTRGQGKADEPAPKVEKTMTNCKCWAHLRPVRLDAQPFNSPYTRMNLYDVTDSAEPGFAVSHPCIMSIVLPLVSKSERLMTALSSLLKSSIWRWMPWDFLLYDRGWGSYFEGSKEGVWLGKSLVAGCKFVIRNMVVWVSSS